MFRLCRADQTQGQFGRAAPGRSVPKSGRGPRQRDGPVGVGRQERPMLKGLLGSVAALAAGAGLAFGQPSRSVLPAVDPPPAAAAPGATAAPPIALEPGVLPPGYATAPPAVVPPGFDGPGLFGGDNGARPGSCYMERAWASFEYLLWKPRNGPNPWPLAVQG